MLLLAGSLLKIPRHIMQWALNELFITFPKRLNHGFFYTVFACRLDFKRKKQDERPIDALLMDAGNFESWQEEEEEEIIKADVK